MPTAQKLGAALAECARDNKPESTTWRQQLAPAVEQLVKAWWDHHVRQIQAGGGLHDGNTRQKKWTARDGAPFYGLLLALALLLAACAASAARMHAHVPAEAAFLCLLYCMSLLGFAYTNYVTTHRCGLLQGRHGDYEDILIVSALIPAVLAFIQYGRPAFVTHTLLPDAPVDGSVAAVSPALLMFVAVYFLGLHVPYLTRTGLLARSVSQRDIATAGFGGWLGLSFKLGGLVLGSIHHLRWAGEERQMLIRVAAYSAVIAGVAAVSVAVRERYSWHLHHWQMGLALLPLCHQRNVLWTAALQAVCVSQLVEGAARWSAAPLWHGHGHGHGVAVAVSASSGSTTPLPHDTGKAEADHKAQPQPEQQEKEARPQEQQQQQAQERPQAPRQAADSGS